MAQQDTQIAMAKESSLSSVLGIIPSLLWFTLAVILILYFRRQFIELMDFMAWRIRSGASIKISVFELGAIQVSRTTKKSLIPDTIRKDESREFHASRQQFR